LSRFAASFRLPDWEIGIHLMMRGEAEFYSAVANSATKARKAASALDLIEYWNAGSPSFRWNDSTALGLSFETEAGISYPASLDFTQTWRTADEYGI
jgi:hypothetical protein